MIEKDPPFFWDVSCDKCSSGEERVSTDDAETFPQVVNYIKEYGWKIRKDGNDWQHICPSCAEKS